MNSVTEEKKGARVTYQRAPDALTPEQRKNIDELLANPGRAIDTSDIPELSPEFWKNAMWGRVLPANQAGGEPAA